MSAPAWEIRRFAMLPSTNAYLLDEARAGGRAGLVAVADHQTAGRGRLGRRWEAPAGTSLLVSVLLRPVMPFDRLYCCTAALALAAADACESVAGVAPLVKWPNDLVVDDRKLAGVLAELDPSAPGGAEGSVAVVAGIGVNVDWAGPEGVAATSLAEQAARPVARDALLDALLGSLGRRVAGLGTEAGRRHIVAGVCRRSATVGRRVRVEMPAPRAGVRTITGTATAITAAGHLVVETALGAVDVPVGDVVHLRVQDATDHAGR